MPKSFVCWFLRVPQTLSAPGHPSFLNAKPKPKHCCMLLKIPKYTGGPVPKHPDMKKKKNTHIDVIHPHVLNNYNHIYIYLYNISIYTYTYHSYVLAATAAKRDSPQCAGNCFLPFTASTDAGRLRGLENPAELIGRCDSGGGFSGGKRSTDRPLWCWRHKKRHGTINGHPFYEHILNGDRRYSLEFVWISWYISYRYAANRCLFFFFFAEFPGSYGYCIGQWRSIPACESCCKKRQFFCGNEHLLIFHPHFQGGKGIYGGFFVYIVYFNQHFGC